MAKLKDIRGTGIQFLDEDPVVNTGSGGAWATGGNLNTARWITTGCAYGYTGTATLALCVGGRLAPGSYSALNEEYDGTSWTEKGDINSARDQLGGSGTSTSAIVAGGYDGTVRAYSESWNGSSWTETSDLNTARYELGSAGASASSAIRFSGAPSKTETETWNGSSWTEVAEVNTHATAPAGAGTATAALKISGEAPTPGANVNVEQWNGSAWTEINNVNVGRRYGVGAGDVSNALFFGGGPSATASTEIYNGSSWTEGGDLGTAVMYSGGGGNNGSTVGINYGGQTPPVVATTETFSVTPVTASALIEGQMWFNSTSSTLKAYGSGATPTGTFASGGNLTVAKNAAAGAGTQSAGIFMGGRLGPPPNAAVNETELYNGSTWTEVNNLTTARYSLGGANAGSQTATLAFGGYSTTDVANTESWDGTNWTEVNDLNTAGSNGAGFGTQPAAIYTGGDNRSNNKTESWDGTSWTETTDLNTARAQMAGFGLATAGLICGGDLYPVTSPTRLSVQTELWDGSAWTEVNDLNTGRRRIGNGGFGTQTSGLTAGGYTTTYVANTESWNGTSWAEQTEIQTRDNTTGIGTGAPSGLIAGGGTSPGAMSNATEEWTVDNKILTVTTS